MFRPAWPLLAAFVVVIIAGCEARSASTGAVARPSTAPAQAADAGAVDSVAHSAKPCTDRDVRFQLATVAPVNSGEGSLYVRVRNVSRAGCAVDGYPVVHVLAGGSRAIITRVGGDPAIHSPVPRRAVVASRHSVFFGIGWHTNPLPHAPHATCAVTHTIVVSLQPEAGTRLHIPAARTCPWGAVDTPYVAVSSILRTGQFPDANP
jgi:hypothetical protein